MVVLSTGYLKSTYFISAVNQRHFLTVGLRKMSLCTNLNFKKTNLELS